MYFRDNNEEENARGRMTAQHGRSWDRASKGLEDGTTVRGGQSQLVISLAVERVDYERQQRKNCPPLSLRPSHYVTLAELELAI